MRRTTGLSPDRVSIAQTRLVLQSLLRQDLRDASRPQRSGRDNRNYYVQALGAGGQRAGTPHTPPASATSRRERARAPSPSPERGWLSLLPGRSLSERRGNPGTGSVQPPRDTEKLRPRRAPSGTRRSQGPGAGTTPAPEGQARWERRWDAEAGGPEEGIQANQPPAQPMRSL